MDPALLFRQRLNSVTTSTEQTVIIARNDLETTSGSCQVSITRQLTRIFDLTSSRSQPPNANTLHFGNLLQLGPRSTAAHELARIDRHPIVPLSP